MNADLSATDTVGKPNSGSSTFAPYGRKPLRLTVVTRHSISGARPLSIRNANVNIKQTRYSRAPLGTLPLRVGETFLNRHGLA